MAPSFVYVSKIQVESNSMRTSSQYNINRNVAAPTANGGTYKTNDGELSWII